jgi:hypothetical protein
VHVDRLDAQHVVDAAFDADPRARAPAGARRRPHAPEVARAVAQQRRGLAAQVRPHELTVGVVLERDRCLRAGFDELEHGVARDRQVQAGARLALAGHRRPDVAHPEAVGDGGAPGRLDLRAHGAEARAGLAGGHDVAQAERRRVDPGLARAAGQVRGERERAVDRGEPEAGDELEQAQRLADADGDDGRSGSLDRHVIGDPARVERVVQAVGDDVVGAQAGDRERGAADGGVRLVITAREADRHRLAGRTRRDVQAHQVRARRAQVLAEGRPGRLRGAQVGLGQQRDVGQSARAGDPLAVEGRAAFQIGELGLQRRVVVHARAR